ncbi:histone H3.v1-like [Scylla paramamosain]|uniref:histone H3.v1-like n=1 Tax=Scylla paramamosain TaxID=85552 RepID=UPI003083ECFF
MDTALPDDPNTKELLWETALIDKVKQHPQLYDFNHKEYKEAQKCTQTWLSIAKQLGMPGRWKVCKERWRTLRDVYVRNRKSFLVGRERGRWPRWKFFDQMNFLHAYICHRPAETEKPLHDIRIQWQDSKLESNTSDSDSNDESTLPHEAASLAFEGVKCKTEEEEEEEEEIERQTKRARFTDNLSTMQERDIRSSAVEDFEAELLHEADPLSFTFDGRPIKQEVEWADEEMDTVDKSFLKEASPTPSLTPPTPLPTPPPPPPPLLPTENNKPLILQLKLPGGKSIPATIITNTKQGFINRKVGMIMPTPLRTVPIKIKTVTGSQMRASCLTPILSSSPLPYSQQAPTIPILKEDGKHTSSPKSSTGSTPCPEPVPLAAEVGTSQEGVLEDEEELFGRYIAAAIRKLTRKSRSHAKMQIQQVLFNLEESDRSSQVNGKGSIVAGSEQK